MFERVKRFYIDKDLAEELEIDDDMYHHIKNVLRSKIGERFVFINEKEIGEYQFYFGMKKSGIFVLNQKKTHDILDYKLTVYLGIIQREYLDYVIEKLGEIGVTKVVPLITKRSIKTLNSNTYERIKKLLIKGILQAEHNFLPEICDSIDIKDIVFETENNFILYEREDHKSKMGIKSKSVSLVIGPEGGFEDDEVDLIISRGGIPISPIKGVLKAETAALLFAGYAKILIDTM
jgi:16S rRNA (uracil1498-N3)-methyltransferase